MAQISLPQDKQKEQSHKQTLTLNLSNIISSLLLSWEIYPILFIAAFLRLLHIDRAMFNDDEASVFRIAHDAVAYGLLPLTSNRASFGNLNPPLVVYFLMLPASLSANPLWGQVMVALFNTAAVLLTYLFTRRYYGRLAGTIAALLYATSIGAWTFSRNIWPQNFLPFFVILFMFLLFRGVVERRKGWFFWAIVVLGVLCQFHGSSLYLLIPLGAAVLLAFKTIRPREIGLALVALLLLFAPYIYWEIHSHFSDIIAILDSTKQQARIDTEALHFYLFFLHPTVVSPYLDFGARVRDVHIMLPVAQSVLVTTPLRYLHPFIRGSFYLAVLLLAGGIAIAALQVLSLEHFLSPTTSAKEDFTRWWADFWASPYRQGLVLLLLWQVAPLLLLSDHSIVLFAHYFIFFLPGQFILIALCVVQTIAFIQKQEPRLYVYAHYGMAILAALVILAQLIGCTGDVIDLTTGNFNDHAVIRPFNDLQDQQNALQEADQLAQRRHIHRIYVMTTFDTASAMDYLAGQVKTPIELVDSANCFVLPAPQAGPVVFLAQPDSQTADMMLSQYTNATLVAEPPRLGGDPYKLYVLTAEPEPAPVPGTFTQGLQLLSPTAQLFQNFAEGQAWLTVRWRILNTNKPAFRTNYGYHFHIAAASRKDPGRGLDCEPTSTWAGDQLIAYQTPQIGKRLPARISIQVSTFVQQPQVIDNGPLKLFTYHELNNLQQTLLTVDRKNNIILPITNNSSGS
jgi:4-amino-4-deoxy-L-arabinose transferase-like glycosyltransferase